MPATIDPFHVARASNAYDRLLIDPVILWTTDRSTLPAPPPVGRLYARRVLPLNQRLHLWKLAHRLNLDRAWFTEFAAYWTGVLGGRPLLSPEDFHFLRGVYRLRHQDNQVPDYATDADHLAAWQQPELLYQLFQQVYVESLSPRERVLRLLQRYVPHGRCLDFGCAAGSITATDRDFCPRQRRWHLTDLPTVALHFAAWRFRDTPDVAVEPLGEGFRVPTGPFDAICCLTVLEHLPRPLETVRQCLDALPSGGSLIFDYVQSDGTMLDTRAGMMERPLVLDYLAKQSDVVYGRLTPERSMDLTIVRKR